MDPETEELHRAAEEQGLDSYTDPVTGYAVFTATYLAAKGPCCGSGCRHCPYDSSADWVDEVQLHAERSGSTSSGPAARVSRVRVGGRGGGAAAR